jgi:imidazolonepropionase-like amidohydrolase
MSLLAALVLSACLHGNEPGRPAVASALAFVDVNVVAMDSDRVLAGQTVVVRDGVIAEVGPSRSVRIPPGALRVEGVGRYLMPGLTDFHVHLRDPSELLSYLAYGVTSVVHLSGPMGNVPDVMALRAEVARGGTPGPTIYASGRVLDGDPPIFPRTSVVVRTAEEAIRVVAGQKAGGADLVKVYNNLEDDALRAAVRAAHERGLPVAGHIPRRIGRDRALQAALAAGLDVIAHGEEYFFTFFHGQVEALLDKGLVPTVDRTGIPEAVRRTKEAGAAVTPNLSFIAMTRAQLDDLAAVLADPETAYLHPSVRDMWKEQNPTRRDGLERFDRRERAKYPFVQELTAALHRAGVPLLLGTDASASGLFPGRSAHLELSELVKAGLTPYHALVAGTRAAGAFIGRWAPAARPFGTVTPGSRADLVLVRGNPMEDVRHASAIEGVVVRGRWLDAGELRALRERARARERASVSTLTPPAS